MMSQKKNEYQTGEQVERRNRFVVPLSLLQHFSFSQFMQETINYNQSLISRIHTHTKPLTRSIQTLNIKKKKTFKTSLCSCILSKLLVTNHLFPQINLPILLVNTRKFLKKLRITYLSYQSKHKVSFISEQVYVKHGERTSRTFLM